MKRLLFAAVAALALGTLATGRAEAKNVTIALIPGLTTDAFYITMHKGALAAAKALGDTLVFQGAPDFNPVTQVPVLDAVIARHPDVILIAPTDKVQLDPAAEEGDRRGHQGDHGRYLHRHRQIPDRCGDADFPLSYVASDNILGGQIAARALRSRSATRARSTSPTSSPAFPRPTSARKASRRR